MQRVFLGSVGFLRAVAHTALAGCAVLVRRRSPRNAETAGHRNSATGLRPTWPAPTTALDPTFDPETREWADRVLSGEIRHPFPPGDPEGEHDACRLRGVLECLCRTSPPIADDRLRWSIQALLGYAADRCDRIPAIGWDATTAAVRLVNLLAADTQLQTVGARLSDYLGDWFGSFLDAHRLPLRVGRLTEPSGNHRLLNSAGHIAFFLLVSPGRPTHPRLVAELAEQVGRQFLPDGGHCERVPHYHTEVLAVLETLQRADEQRGGTLRARLRPLLQSPLQALGSMLAPGWEPYRVGDLGRTFSGKPSSVEAMSLMGGRMTSPDDLTTRLPLFGVASSTWLADGQHHLLAECGATGAPWLRGHGHADTHAFCYYLDGSEVVADPGTFLYADTPEAIWFRTPQAHSVVHWPRYPAAVPSRFFRWARRPPTGEPEGELPATKAGVLFASVTTWRVGTRRFTHRRTWMRDGSGLGISDTLITPRPANAELRFPLGPDVAVVDISSRGAIVKALGRSVEFRVTGSGVGTGAVVPAWHAARYGVRSETVALVWPIAAGGRRDVYTRIAPIV